MNERILELAQQAGITTNLETDFFEKNANEWVDYFAEKFAELIVQECIEQGKQVQSQTVSNGSKDYVDGREMGIEVFMNQIKKHFGVEE